VGHLQALLNSLQPGRAGRAVIDVLRTAIIVAALLASVRIVMDMLR
jgi:hypothetical protein